jgi:hypothetical protein
MTTFEALQHNDAFVEAGRIAFAMRIVQANNPYVEGWAREAWDNGHQSAEREAFRTARIIKIHASLAGQKAGQRKGPSRVITYAPSKRTA